MNEMDRVYQSDKSKSVIGAFIMTMDKISICEWFTSNIQSILGIIIISPHKFQFLTLALLLSHSILLLKFVMNDGQYSKPYSKNLIKVD